jgi:hypothetical protein
MQKELHTATKPLIVFIVGFSIKDTTFYEFVLHYVRNIKGQTFEVYVCDLILLYLRWHIRMFSFI